MTARIESMQTVPNISLCPLCLCGFLPTAYSLLPTSRSSAGRHKTCPDIAYGFWPLWLRPLTFRPPALESAERSLGYGDRGSGAFFNGIHLAVGNRDDRLNEKLSCFELIIRQLKL